MSFREKKRSPFGETAPNADLANNRSEISSSSDQPTCHDLNSTFARDPTAARKRHQLEPPPSVMTHSKASTSARASIPRGGSATHRVRYLLPNLKATSPPSTVNNRGNKNPEDSEMRARFYKAEAYEAKIRNASQEQQMNALKHELDELRFFAAVEQGIPMESSTTTSSKSKNDSPPKDEEVMGAKQMRADKDAELIECLATELEQMEKELKKTRRQLKEQRSKNQSLNDEVERHSKLLLGDLQHQLDAEKAKNESLSEEISLLVARGGGCDEIWKTKEAALNRTIENQQAELNKSKKNNAEVATTLREIEGAVFRLQRELDAEKSKNQSVSVKAESANKEQWQHREAELKKKIERQQGELSKWKKDTADGVTIMRELEGALRKARKDNADLRAMVEESEDATNSLVQLEEELKNSQNERDDALRELSSLREEYKRLSEQSEADAAKYNQLVQSNEELHGVLSTAQSQLEKKVEALRQDLSESKEREQKLREDYQISIERYDQQKREADELKSALDDLANSFEKQKIDLELKSSAMEELEEVHATSIVKHASELEASELRAQTQMKALSSLQLKYQSQLMTFQCQIEALKESAVNNSDGPDDEVRAEIDEKLKHAQIQVLGSDDKRCLENEVSTLRARVANAEGTESRLRQQILLLSEELSEADAAYKEIISNLQRELGEMTTHGMSSSHYKSVDSESRDSDSGEELSIKRKQIENDALKDYVARRWQDFDP
ncbi:hypothetical protein ACHAXM_010682 [Skeletonema potamos]